jgi:hypothetical protein
MSPSRKYEEYRLLDGDDALSTKDLPARSEHSANNSSLRERVPFPRLWRGFTIASLALLSHVLVFCMGFKFRQLAMTDGLSPYCKSLK